MLRILFVGLGSIGKRHLHNISDELKKREIAFSADALRHGDSPLGDCEELVSRTFHSTAELNGDYDIVFITNPTSLHREMVEALMGKAKAMFIEKPLFMSEYDTVEWGKGLYYVACPLRRSPVLARLKQLLPSLKVIRAEAICSSYLPEWRTGDYRKSYSAIACLGGGVRLDLIHEWDYLKWFFGEPEKVVSLSGKFSELEMDCDDSAAYIAMYPKMLLTLTLDYIGRSSQRGITLFTDEDVIVGDIIKNEIRYLKSGKVEHFEPADIHRIETDEFLDLVLSGGKNENDPASAIASLRLANM